VNANNILLLPDVIVKNTKARKTTVSTKTVSVYFITIIELASAIPCHTDNCTYSKCFQGIGCRCNIFFILSKKVWDMGVLMDPFQASEVTYQCHY